MIWDIQLSETENGECPVVDFLKSIQSAKLKANLKDLELLEEFGTNLREPRVKYVQDGLFELRTQFSSNIARIFFFYQKNKIIIAVSGYTKKSNKIPKRIMKRALKYKMDYERRYSL